MADLKHATIYRGGVTSPHSTLETTRCSFGFSGRPVGFRETAGHELAFGFQLASKGGGTTEVGLWIGRDDLPVILKTIAHNMPELEGLFIECLGIMSRANLVMLADAVHNVPKASPDARP